MISVKLGGIHHFQFVAPGLLLGGRVLSWLRCLSQCIEEVHRFGHAAAVVVLRCERVLGEVGLGYLCPWSEVMGGCDVLAVGDFGDLALGQPSEEVFGSGWVLVLGLFGGWELVFVGGVGGLVRVFLVGGLSGWGSRG